MQYLNRQTQTYWYKNNCTQCKTWFECRDEECDICGECNED